MSAVSAVAPAAEPVYNTPFLTDAQLVAGSSMTANEIRAFLASRNSYFRQSVADVDGVVFDPAAVIAEAAQQYTISPKVLLATLQKEHSGVTRTTRPTESQMAFLMGCRTPTTARAQLACAAERFRFYHDGLINNGATVSGWRVGVAKMTQDGVIVTPATRAVAGQFTYTPYAGVQWGGNRATVGGVYIFYNAWNVFGFFDSTRPTASATAPGFLADGRASHTFTVTFADDAGVDVSDITSNHAAVRVTGPNGFSRLATFVSLDSSADGSPRQATYRVTGPGAGSTWDAADAGTYTVSMAEAQVSDVNNNFVAAGAVGTFRVRAPATVIARRVFYNNSVFDGYDPAANVSDDGAIAPDKSGLRPGHPASFGHVTSYTKGINGVVIDVAGLPTGAALTSEDFTFRSGTTPDPNTWAAGPAPSSVAVRRGAGAGQSDRVTLTWSDYNPVNASPVAQAVANGWLQVTLKAGANTDLLGPDVFYFGNLIGEAGDPFSPLRVTASDFNATRSALFTRAAPPDRHDFDRSGLVSAADVLTARRHLAAALAPLTAPAAAAAVATPFSTANRLRIAAGRYRPLRLTEREYHPVGPPRDEGRVPDLATGSR